MRLLLLFLSIASFKISAEEIFFELNWPTIYQADAYEIQVTDQKDRLLLREQVLHNSYVWKVSNKLKGLKFRYRGIFQNKPGDFSNFSRLRLRKNYQLARRINTFSPGHKKVYKSETNLQKILFRFEEINSVSEYQVLIGSRSNHDLNEKSALINLKTTKNKINLVLPHGQYRWKVIGIYPGGEKVESWQVSFQVVEDKFKDQRQLASQNKSVESEKSINNSIGKLETFSFGASLIQSNFGLKLEDQDKGIDYQNLGIKDFSGFLIEANYNINKKYGIEASFNSMTASQVLDVHFQNFEFFVFPLRVFDQFSILEMGIGNKVGGFSFEERGEFKYETNYNMASLKLKYTYLLNQYDSIKSELTAGTNIERDTYLYNLNFQSVYQKSIKNTGRFSLVIKPGLIFQSFTLSPKGANLNTSSFGALINLECQY